MMFGKSVIRLAQTAVIIFLLTTSSAVMAKAHLGSDPDPSENPVLAQYLQQGAKVYFMGSHGGLNGWFIIKDNQIQMGYTTADNKNLVIGALFDETGANYSSTQFQALYNDNKEVNTFINSLDVGGINNANMAIAQMQQRAPAGIPSLAPLPVAPPALPAGIPPGERLYHELLSETANVPLGASGSPLILMIMDPNCPHCQKTWRELRDAVFKNEIQVRLIPIGMNDEDDRAGAVLLEKPDALQAWDKYVDGDKSQLAGVAPIGRLADMKTNHILMNSWHIELTPYLVYRNKDGQIKVLEGEPEQIAALLKDLKP